MADDGASGEGLGRNPRFPTIRVTGVIGPLFVCEDPSLFSAKFPQMRKKDYSSAHLGIEELEYLGQFFSIEFETEEDEQHYFRLHVQQEFSCRVYRHLTDNVGLFLRYGGRFGAAFIGYRDLEDHGNCLVYLGPLSRLSAVASARVAAGVGKEAWVVEESSVGSAVCMQVLKLENIWEHSRQGCGSFCGEIGERCGKKRRLSCVPIAEV